MSTFCYVRRNVFTTNLLYTKMNRVKYGRITPKQSALSLCPG